MSANRQYGAMPAAATERLRGRDPVEIASRAGIALEGGVYRFETFGRAVKLDVGSFAAEPALEMWHHLTVLQYLDSADASRPTDRWIGMDSLADGGMVRGASFNREVDAVIAGRLSPLSEDELRRRFEALGAVWTSEAQADLCADFYFMPNYPYRLSLWLADDEFPASGKVRVNAGVRRSLGLEAVGTMAVYLVNRVAEGQGS